MNTMDELITQGPSYLARFNPWTMHFLHWENAFEYVMDFLQITNDRKVEFLLYMIEPSAITIVEKIFFYTELYDLTYDELLSNLEDTFGQYSGKHAAEYRFWCRYQMIGESVPHYVLALRKIISKCDSECNTSENLTSQFITGLRSNTAKSLLQKKQNVTLNKAVAIARQIELLETMSRFK